MFKIVKIAAVAVAVTCMFAMASNQASAQCRGGGFNSGFGGGYSSGYGGGYSSGYRGSGYGGYGRSINSGLSININRQPNFRGVPYGNNFGGSNRGNVYRSSNGRRY